MKETHKKAFFEIGRFGAMAAAAFITLAVAGTSLVLGFTIPTFAEIDTDTHHHCQSIECEKCLVWDTLYEKEAGCSVCYPPSSNKLKPEIIGIIGALTALGLGVPFVIFLSQRRKETKEILVKTEQN